MAVPRIIAIDMDGTLLGPDGRVSERNLRALEMAREAGVEVVIATGRRHCFAMGPLRGLGLCEENALISSNGTVIRTLGAELVHRTHMPVETALWVVANCGEFRSSIVMTFDTVQPDGEDTRGALVCENGLELRNTVNAWMDANAAYMQHVERLEDALCGDPPIQMMMCGPVRRMEEAMERLLESPFVKRSGELEDAETKVVLHRTAYPKRDLMILDILPAGCSKASALRLLADADGVAMEDVLAIGDNWNDLPMLEYAGAAVVMANAPRELREMAAARGWTLAPGHDEDGVAWAIERALELRPEKAAAGASETAPMVV